MFGKHAAERRLATGAQDIILPHGERAERMYDSCDVIVGLLGQFSAAHS
jgi:hypothetical protein